MADRTLRIGLDADTKKMVAGLDTGIKKLGDLADANDEAASAGQKVAAGLSRMADIIEGELTKSTAAAEALAAALGSDTVAAFERTGTSAQDLVAELRTTGLTYQDIGHDADSLAASLKKMSSVGEQIGTHITKPMKGVARETDNSRSVMANFAGNAAQELPGVAGAFGPLNMAISQFTEYATEGNVKMSGLVATGLGIGAASLAMMGLSEHTKHFAEIEAFRTENVKGWADALEGADGRVQAILDHIKELGGLKAVIGDANSWFGGPSAVIDATYVLTQLGVTADTAAKLIAGGKDQVRQWGDAMVAAGANTGQVKFAMEALSQQVDAVDKAEQNNAITTAFLGGTQTEAATTSATLTRHLLDLTSAAADAAQAAEDHEQAAAREADALDKVRRGLDIKSGYVATTGAIQNLVDVMHDSTASAYDQQSALSSTEGAVLSYLDTLGNVPASKQTEILALIDAGKYNEAAGLINELTRNRVATISVVTIYDSTDRGAAKNTRAIAQAQGIQYVDSFNAGVAKATSGGGGGKSAGKTIADSIAKDLGKVTDAKAKNKFEIGDLSEAAYRKYLTGRLKAYAKYSDDYMVIWREIQSLGKDQVAKEGSLLKDTIKAGQDALKEQQSIEDNKHDIGVISNSAYKKILEERLKHVKKYSDEWTRIYKDIQNLSAPTAAGGTPTVPSEVQAIDPTLAAAEDAINKAAQAGNTGLANQVIQLVVDGKVLAQVIANQAKGTR
jgi:hypothetical protein